MDGERAMRPIDVGLASNILHANSASLVRRLPRHRGAVPHAADTDKAGESSAKCPGRMFALIGVYCVLRRD